MVRTSRRWVVGGLLLAAGCSGPTWSRGQIEEAYRNCRAEIGFPPISALESDQAAFASFMCHCEVEYLADRVEHADYASGRKVDLVNRVLFHGRSACLAERGAGGR